MNLEELKNKTYLGDGAYAGHDGFHVWLYTSNGIDVTNEVALDPHVLESFKSWLEKYESGKS